MLAKPWLDVHDFQPRHLFHLELCSRELPVFVTGAERTAYAHVFDYNNTYSSLALTV